MCFIERETRNFILKFSEIFLWREKVLRAHEMKADEKLFFCQIYAIVWGKMVPVAIDRYFSLFLKGWRFFSQPNAITDSPFKIKDIVPFQLLSKFFTIRTQGVRLTIVFDKDFNTKVINI